MGSLRLTVIGSDGSWPGPGGACSSYLVRSDTTAVLVDMGTGSLAAAQLYISPWQLDAIFLTHEHKDHCSDIKDLDVMAHLANRALPPVYASSGVLKQTFPGHSPRAIAEWNVMTAGERTTIGDIAITTALTDHPVVTHALRFDHNGRSLVYTADTSTKWSVAELGTDISVALCEAVDRAHIEQDWHMNSLQAARSAKAGRLLLTHIRPGVDRDAMVAEARQQFDGDVQVARPGMTIEV